MKLTIQSSGSGLAHVLCTGEVTLKDLPREGDPFVSLLGLDCFAGKVLVNLEKTEYVDSAGVGWWLMAHKRFKEGGGMLVLHSIPPLVNQIFKLLNMGTVLHIALNEEAALALAQGGKA